MSRKLEEYGAQKSCAITAAKRLASFLGEEMIKDKGLVCSYIISKKPHGLPVTQRVIPTAIFSVGDSQVTRTHLRKWTATPSMQEVDIREILDWGYYRERLVSVIQKIITIPAVMQKMDNPVPRIHNPDWLEKQLRDRDGLNKQQRITDLFSAAIPKTSTNTTASDNNNNNVNTPADVEDMFGGGSSSSSKHKSGRPTVTVHKRYIYLFLFSCLFIPINGLDPIKLLTSFVFWFFILSI